MTCDNCKIGISFGSSCFHCSENWIDRFIKNVKKKKFSEKSIRYELECLSEEVYENFTENE